MRESLTVKTNLQSGQGFPLTWVWCQSKEWPNVHRSPSVEACIVTKRDYQAEEYLMFKEKGRASKI